MRTIGIPAVPVKTVFVKIRIELGAVRGNSKLLVALVAAVNPGLAAFVADTTQFVLLAVNNSLVVGLIVQPAPNTLKLITPVPEPPEVLKSNRTAEEEILFVPVTINSFCAIGPVGVGVGVGADLIVATAVGVGVGVTVARTVGVRVGVGVGVVAGLIVGVAAALGVGVIVTLTVGVGVVAGLTVGVVAALGVGVIVTLTVGVGVVAGLIVGVVAALGVGVTVTLTAGVGVGVVAGLIVGSGIPELTGTEIS